MYVCDRLCEGMAYHWALKSCSSVHVQRSWLEEMLQSLYFFHRFCRLGLAALQSITGSWDVCCKCPGINCLVLCSVLEPYGSGLYWIVCHILAFLGVFLCLLMTSMYDTNIAITGGNNKQNPKVGSQAQLGSGHKAF